MTLLYITNGINGSGGLERVLSIKASYLADIMGYNVHIIKLNQKNAPLFYKFSNKLIYHDIEVKGNIIKYLSDYRKGINSVVKSIRPDIISVCDDGYKGFYTPLIIGKHYPMVYERHASINIFKNTDRLSFIQNLKFKLLNKLMLLGARHYDAFVVLTKGNLKEWNLKNLHVIPNPLSFYPENQSSLKNKKVITVGNHGFQKGYDRLLKSWKQINNKYPDWQLEVFGKIDPDKKHIKLAETLSISDSVSFFNPVKNIQDKYNEASIYAMSSRSEGFGMVLIEAMAYGLPCVSFDCPNGPRDIITNKRDGFLIENGDIDTFSLKISALIEDEKLRVKMGGNARLKAEMYLPEKIIPQWDTLFSNLTNSNK